MNRFLVFLPLLSLTACDTTSPWVGTWNGTTSECDASDQDLTLLIEETDEKGVGSASLVNTILGVEGEGIVTCQGEPAEVDLDATDTLTFLYELSCSNDQVVTYTIGLTLETESTISGTVAFGSTNCQVDFTLEAVE